MLHDGTDPSGSSDRSAQTKIQCAACGRYLKGEIKSHMKNSHPDFEYKCLTCGEPVLSWHDHVSHANDHHAGIIKRKCNSCDMTFNSQTELTSHKSHNHYGKADRDGQFDVCIKCGEQIKNKSRKTKSFWS